jgi:hypothetical protein
VIPKRRRLAVAVLGLAILLTAILAAILMEGPRPGLPPRPASERPQLLLLTSLPILFPEQLSLESKPEPVRTALESRYTIKPVSVADRASLDGHRLLLMAQPKAQPAEVLVELDAWVRSGGHVLVLADPALEWPSKWPLASPLRPPLAVPDTGLLGHWGLRLDAPDSSGPMTIEAGTARIETSSPGVLVATGGNCSVEDGFVAHCRVGRGEATVIGDADFIDVADSASPNLTLLLRELNRLER